MELTPSGNSTLKINIERVFLKPSAVTFSSPKSILGLSQMRSLLRGDSFNLTQVSWCLINPALELPIFLHQQYKELGLNSKLLSINCLYLF